MAKNYPKNSSREVQKAIHEHKPAGKFKNRKHVIAVGFNKARQSDKTKI